MSLDYTEQEFPEYKPSEKEKKAIMKLCRQFEEAKKLREMPLKVLNNRTMVQYWDDCEQRWNGYVPNKRRKDWQSQVVKPVTRTKCIGVIANVLSMLIEPTITAQKGGRNNDIIAQAFSDVLELTQDNDEYTKKNLMVLTDAVSLGTAYLQEDYVVVKRKVKIPRKGQQDVPIEDQEDWEEKEIVEFEGFRTQVVPPHEIYLGDLFTFEFQDQPFFFRRIVMSYDNFMTKFGSFENAKFVSPHNSNTSDRTEATSFNQAQEQADLLHNDVEVLIYQCKYADEMAIMANKVLLTKPGQPLPYAHKSYNTVKVVYEMFSSRCAIGKSLTDRLRWEQDVIDTLYRMIIDKTFLSIFPPLLSKGGTKITTDIFQPGRITPIDDDTSVGVPEGMQSGLGNEMNVLREVESSMDAQSLDKNQLGADAGGQRTATQTMEAKAGAQKILGLFAFMISFMIEDAAKLRVQNIIQFWAKYERYVEVDGKEEVIRSVFEISNRVLADGSTGTRVVDFMPKEMHPTPGELYKEEKTAADMGQKVQRIVIDPLKVHEYRFYVKVEANPSERLTPALEKALALEFFDRFKDNQLVAQDVLLRETIRKMHKNPDTFILKQPPQPPPGMESEMGAPKRPGSQGKGNITSQLSAAAQPQLKTML